MWKVNKAPQFASMGAICKKWPPVKSILKTGRGQHITNNCGCLSMLAQLAVQQAIWMGSSGTRTLLACYHWSFGPEWDISATQYIEKKSELHILLIISND